MKSFFCRFVFLGFLFAMSVPAMAQMEPNANPMHLFFEYGPVGKLENGSPDKTNSHIAAGLKIHKWKEDRPFQFEIDMNYRGITFYDSSETKHSLGLAEMYLGPRLLISKTSPLYPTASVLGGWCGNLGTVGGLNALLSLGLYYNFTPPGTNRNGVSLEITYRTANIKYNEFTIPPAIGIRLGFFF
jgi:hypothetical protein